MCSTLNLIKTMKKQVYFASALLLLGMFTLSCSKIESNNETPEEIIEEAAPVKYTFTGSVSAKTPTTKSVNVSGETAWEEGEEIAVYYQKDDDSFATTIATVGERRPDGSAPFTATLEDAKDGTTVKFVYPATLVSASGELDASAMAAQHGTIADISANFDAATGSGTLVTNGTSCGTSEQVTMTNRALIGKFTPKYGGVAIDEITTLTVTDGTNTYTVTPAAPETAFDDEGIYVAMLPVDNQEVIITACTATQNYGFGGKKITLAAGKLYTNLAIAMSRLVDLATVTANTTLLDGDFVTGTLDVANYPVQISIADDASVTLSKVSIIGIDDASYPWAGITCTGDATITLSGTNTVTGFKREYPGIQAGPAETTLTIQGTGSLTASCNSINSGGYAAGIGAASVIPCGNIVIAGGNITANGGADAAGIGGASDRTCGNITISGGTVIARCASEYTYGPGIGSGINATCGNITISGGNVTATASNNGAAGIGTGGMHSTCGNILISGGTVVATGSDEGPGIGAGYSYCTCGSITIRADITSVTATRGSNTRTGDSSHTDPCIGAVVPGAGSNNCGYIYFGTSQMTTNKKAMDYPLTFLRWSPWPTSGSDYGGLHIEISNEERTWTLTPASS